jgi:O-succinylbenzoic acid--CoA ligase
METPLKMDVKDVQRDWIVGFSGEAFSSLVREQAARFAANDAVAERGVLLAESDPIRFSTAFFAGLSLGVPLILANPKWGSAEWAALSGLVNPAMIVGNVPMDTTTREGVHHPLPGQILIPTGGTTGGVKLAIHDWASLLAATRGLHDFLGGDPIHSSCLLPLHHVSGLMQLVRAFSTGGQIRFDEAVTAGYCVSLVPTQLQRSLSDAAAVERLRVARAVFVGGAALPEALAAEARKAHLPIVQVYGMTETAAMIAAVPAEDFLNRDAPGAVPLGEAKIGVDSDGGIRVRTPALFQGYHGREPIDLAEGFCTGDRGYLDERGGLHVLGRMDRLINTGGEKVDPAEVEQALLQIEAIEAAQVVGEPDEEWGEVVVAYLQSQSSLDTENIRQRLKEVLSPHKVPKRFKQVEAISACQAKSVG